MIVPPPASLSAAAEEGHAAVLARAKARGQEGMATTLTMGIGVWPVSYTLHVGDSRRDDVEGARAVGMQALWLTRNSTRGDLRSLSELEARLRAGVGEA